MHAELGRWRIRVTLDDKSWDDFTAPLLAEKLRRYLFSFRLPNPEAILKGDRSDAIAAELAASSPAARVVARNEAGYWLVATWA